MNARILDDFVAFVAACSTWHGRAIQINGAISTNGRHFDRHFTTYCQLAFTLQNSYCRLSGGRLTLDGDTQSYEVGGDQLVTLTYHGPARVELIEQYSATVFRQTLIRLR